MSLFPAYCDKGNVQKNVNITDLAAPISTDISNEKNNDPNQNINQNWLQNSSFIPFPKSLQSCIGNESWTDSSDEDFNSPSTSDKTITSENQNKRLPNKKRPIDACQHNIKEEAKFANLKTHLSVQEPNIKNLYFEDKERNKKFCSLEKLNLPLRPRYKKFSKNNLGSIPRKKIDHHFERYYIKNLDAPKNSIKKNEIITLDNNIKEETDILNELKNTEILKQQKVKIENFNQKLRECPTDIDTWIKYVIYQDQITETIQYQYEPKKFTKLRQEKKLSIIEKGLAKNPNAVELLKIKLQLLSEILPADQLSNQIETMIQKDPKNIVLWEFLIIIIRTSCALCTVSKILNVYVKCFAIMKQKSKIEPKFYDTGVLGLLYQCLIFLRHAGLWEQMWEIVRLNICLNLGLDHETLRSLNSIDEKNLIHMEELVLNSKLPLDQLWLRIESLRESCHWSGIDITKIDINLIGDEKRLVSAEETNDFIYPTISRESNFRLVILSILCLKVPLLPNRHCTMKNFSLNEHFWSVDSLEFILPMIYPMVWIGDLDDRLCNQIIITELLEGKLISGPQFLKFHPAQETFTDFIRSVFDTVAKNLPEIQRTSIFIWWLRFERLLVHITKNDPLRQSNRNKKVKTVVKNFLKKPENRNNLFFYREFALIEQELESTKSCLQILKTIIQSQNFQSLNAEDKIALFSLYRTFFEIILSSDNSESLIQDFQETIKSFKNFISTCFDYDYNMSVEEMLYNEILKFLMNSVEDESEDRFLLPNVYCDMLICYACLMYGVNNSDDNLDDILNLFDKCLAHCEKCMNLQERFYEVKIAFLQFCQQKVKNFDNIITKTINESLNYFPNNFFFLSVSALIQSELPFWKLELSCKNNVWFLLANCLAGRARIYYLRNNNFNESCQAMTNKMLAFHKKISKTKAGQGSPLIWRFYMLLLRENDLCQKKGEEVYYEAVAHCPWARSVYISAAEIAPQILSQIQDLIKEKELRIHVTPEELEILRA